MLIIHFVLWYFYQQCFKFLNFLIPLFLLIVIIKSYCLNFFQFAYMKSCEIHVIIRKHIFFYIYKNRKTKRKNESLKLTCLVYPYLVFPTLRNKNPWDPLNKRVYILKPINNIFLFYIYVRFIHSHPPSPLSLLFIWLSQNHGRRSWSSNVPAMALSGNRNVTSS